MLFDRAGAGADYEELVAVQDEASGLRALIAIHSTRLGPAAGGIRRMRYASEQDALADVLRLAETMTWKCALAGLDAGGAKTVILDHAGLRVPEAYRALGRAIDRLGGRYLSGPDVGTGSAEIACVRESTRHVNPEGNDAGAATARGVLAGIRGTLYALDGVPDAAGKRFVVQGLGAVGLAVARGLLDAGATVLGADPSEAAMRRAEAIGVKPVAPDQALRHECDVFVPCALGGVLTEAAARGLPARAVCGSANNPLADDAAARALHERGILYAPDFVVNSGAVIEGILTARHGGSDDVRRSVGARIDDIEHTVRRVLDAAQREGRPPHEVALEQARARVARAANKSTT